MAVKGKMPCHKVIGDESDLTKTGEDNQPETSPYVTTAITLLIGPCAKPYTVLQEFLDQCPILTSKLRPLKYIVLRELDDDAGHTLVHYLYTGVYQTLKLRGVVEDIEVIEYKRSILVYSAAKTYELSGLEMLAKTRMQILEEGISIFDVLDIARELYPKFPEDDNWFFGYLKKKIKTAYEADETLFSKELFLGQFGTTVEFDKALVKTIVEIYNEKIVGLASKSDSACEELSVISRLREPSLVDFPAPCLPYEDPPSCLPCEEATLCEEVTSYEEATPCEEAIFCEEVVSCEEATSSEEATPCEEATPYKETVPCETEAQPSLPCEESALYGQHMEFPFVGAKRSKKGKGRKKKKAQYSWDADEPGDKLPPMSTFGSSLGSATITQELFSFKSEVVLKGEPALRRETEYIIETDAPHELAVEENGICISRATHLFDGEIWKDCRKCRAFIRQASLQLVNEGIVDEDGYNVVEISK